MGRYAYRNQPRIAQWNLARFAQCLLPLLDADKEAAVAFAQDTIDGYPERYQPHWLAVMKAKLGLTTEMENDQDLITDLLQAWPTARLILR